MRKLIAIILVLIGFSSFGQTYLVQPAKWKFTNSQRFDSTVRFYNLPLFTGDTIIAYNPLTGKIGRKILTVSGGTVTSVAALTLGTSGTDLSSTVANSTTTPVITLNVPTASSINRGALSSSDWSTFNGKESVLTFSRGLIRSVNTIRLDTTQFYTWTNARTRWNSAPTATANYGLVSFGSGAFDGSTSGFFVGAAAGTLIAGNLASGSTSDLLNLQLAGVSKTKIDKDGLLTSASITSTGLLRTNSYLQTSSGWYDVNHFNISSNADGVIKLSDNVGTSFNRLQFGGTTSSYPSIKRSTTTLEARLADDSGYSAVQSLYDRFGSGSPESVVTAPIGAIYHRTDGGTGTSLYVKESGTGNTGWIAK